MSEEEIVEDFREISLKRLEKLMSNVEVLKTKNMGHDVEIQILDKYSEELQSKREIFHQRPSKKSGPGLFDVSEIERDFSVIGEILRLNHADSNKSLNAFRQALWKRNYALLFYTTYNFEYFKTIFPEFVFCIGVPMSLIDEKKFLPLIAHEIGHHFYKNDVFEDFDRLIQKEINELKTEGYNPPTHGQQDLVLIEKARFYERVMEEWKKEFFSDLFASHIFGSAYFYAFVLFQMNHAYLSNDEKYPTNKLRCEIMARYMERWSNETLGDIKESYIDCINSDIRVDRKSKIFYEDSIQKTLINDFHKWAKSFEILPDFKEDLSRIIKEG